MNPSKTRSFKCHSWLWTLAMACSLVSLAHADEAPVVDPRSSGPLGLMTTVQTAAADRPTLRRLMQEEGLPQLDRWQRAGLLKKWRVLFSRYADSESFDMLVQLEFAGTAERTRWQQIEQAQPGGLPLAALRLVRNMASVPVDRMRERAAAEAALAPVFLLIPYDYFVSTNDYLSYLDGYVVPQLDGWMTEGVLARYGLYFGRYAAGRSWATMFMLEYRDENALGLRDATVVKVRSRLAAQPAWRAWSDNKQRIRVERAPVIADELTLPAKP